MSDRKELDVLLEKKTIALKSSASNNYNRSRSRNVQAQTGGVNTVQLKSSLSGEVRELRSSLDPYAGTTKTF